MKTNEIIAGLRHCVTTQFTGCKECPAYCRSASCLNRLHTAAADTLEAQQKRIEKLEAERTKPLTAFLSPIDAYKGLKRKFLVFKSDTGEMVENCFVLRPDKDPAAVEALRAYARATDNATLSADIVNWVGEGEERCWIPVTERLPEEHKSVVPGLGTVSKAVLVSWVDPFSKNAYPDNSFVREGITRNGEFTLNHINSDLVPVAWMPTPEPYKPPKEV